MIKNVLRPVCTILLLAFTLIGLSGCFNANEDDSEIPWTRPQSWENTAPGMGGRGNTF